MVPKKIRSNRNIHTSQYFIYHYSFLGTTIQWDKWSKLTLVRVASIGVQTLENISILINMGEEGGITTEGLDFFLQQKLKFYNKISEIQSP